MMYMHYCKRCQRVHILNGHKMKCPRCDSSLTELQISYMDYINMSIPERTAYESRLINPDELSRLSTTYRMYKYSKWYKDMMKQTPAAVYPFRTAADYRGVAAH